MPALRLALLIVSVILALLAGFNLAVPRANLLALSVAALSASMLVP